MTVYIDGIQYPALAMAFLTFLAGFVPAIMLNCDINNSLSDLLFQHKTQVKTTLGTAWIPLLYHPPIVSLKILSN